MKSKAAYEVQSSGHTTCALRALSYTSPSAKFKDMTSGIDLPAELPIGEHFDEEKRRYPRGVRTDKENLPSDNMMISYTAAEGAQGMGGNRRTSRKTPIMRT